jgi:ATP-dependent metalloprotease
MLPQEAYERSSTLLKKHAIELHALASALIEHETLSGEQIKELLLKPKGGAPQPPPSQTPSHAVAVAATKAVASAS